MKKLLLLVLFVPFFKQSEAQFTLTNSSTISLVEVRASSETWPLDLQRIIKENDTTYALAYRDQQFTNSVVMASLKFKDKAQLKYFQQALSSLSKLGTGTTANFKGFSVKRADVLKDIPGGVTAKKPDPKAPPAAPGKKPTKIDEVWYLLTCDDGTVTNFQQSEADKMIAAILPL